MIYDITRTVTPNTAVWPGDTPYKVAHNLAMADGASVNLTTITMSPHTGSHADAVYHYTVDGDHPDNMDLGPYIGAARVVHVTKKDGALVPSDFGNKLLGAARVLIRSHVSDLADNQWADAFPYLSVELIEWLAKSGVVLIGLDSPSVDDFHSTTLPCHNALRENGIVNLELLNLADVPEGDYELVALPLKLAGTCGSPVRAILRN